MKADIDLTASYPYPAERVWAALTSQAALEAWLMPNDFAPVPGHRFTFRTKPAPGFDGIVHCQVLELDPPQRLVWSWAGGAIDTTVTFTLTASADGGTTLRMRQVGFHGLAGQLTRRILGSGWPGLLRRRLLAYLEPSAQPDGDGGDVAQ
ncbi:MAG: SRPBCC domain-containing protein [Actinomycetota bacterium]